MKLVDDLVAGRITLAEAVETLRTHEWRASVDYEPESDPESSAAGSWDEISTDPRLTTEQYRALGEAYVESQE